MHDAPYLKATIPPWLAELGWSDLYEIIDLIGSGGMGQVWRAAEADSGRIVALKVLSPHHKGDEHLLARLDVEAATLIKLRDTGQHPHIVPIIDFKLTDDQACLVMEFIPGLNLSKWCDTHRLDLNDRVKLIAQVARAAGWFHSHDVIHRDLKPANILVSAVTHQPVIVDFSIAKLDDALPLTLTNEALGTAPYMAPEQLDRTRGDIAQATDVYAIGVTLYELLTHVLPHPGDLPQIIQRHQDEVRPARPSLINQDVPRDLESICLKALSPRPQHRYANGEELAADLDRYLAGEPVLARPMSTVAHIARQAKRRPALTAAIAGCLALAFATLALIQRSNRQRHQHELESQVTKAMQAKSWSVETMQQADAALAELAIDTPERSSQLSRAVVEDVCNDVVLALQQEHLSEADQEWMGQVFPLLEPRAPEEMRKLSAQLEERRLRWETLVDLRAPFTNRQGLFPNGRQVIQDGLLFPSYDDGLGNSPAVMIKDHLPIPVEISTTMVATEAFRHVVFDLMFQKTRIMVALYTPETASKEALTLAGNVPKNAQGGFFYILKNTKVETAVHIPDPNLFAAPLSVTITVERDTVTATFNRQWKLTSQQPFAFATGSQDNHFRISWAKNLGMKDLTIRGQSAGQSSLLERGDFHASAEEWEAAQADYEALIGHPSCGPEAGYKLGLTLVSQKKDKEAEAIWERLNQGPPSLWRDLANYQLWSRVVTRQGIAAAKPWLDRLPSPADLSPALVQSIIATQPGDLSPAYASIGWGLSFIRVPVGDVQDAIKVFALLGVSPLKTASQLGSAYHLAGLDDAANALMAKGLSIDKESKPTSTERRLAISVFDQWCRNERSEKYARLRERLTQWSAALPDDSDITTLSLLDQARAIARDATGYQEALVPLTAIHELTNVQSRLLVRASLMEGAILRRLRRSDEARQAWLAGIKKIDESSTQSPLQLVDRIMLHHLTRTWTTAVCTDIITQLIGKTKTGPAGVAMQAMFIRTFANDPVYAAALNSFIDDEEGTKIALDYALAREPIRVIGPKILTKMLEGYFLFSAFPAEKIAENKKRVRATVDQALQFLATSDANPMANAGFLLAWTSPLLRSEFDPEKLHLPIDLRSNFEWMLEQRYARLKER